MKQKLIYVVVLALLIPASFGCVSTPAGTPPDGLKETVVLLHGFGRNGKSMWLLQDRLESAGFDVVVIEYKSTGKSPEAVIDSVSSQINKRCRDKRNVHFVGHSLGGLMIRAYFSKPENKYMLEKLGNVVMFGTPNSGTALVDKYKDRWWLALMGKTALSLGTGFDDLPAKLPVPPFKAGIIAGSNGSFMSDPIFKESNDGIVGVSSTHISNMKDYIEIDVNHTMMRYNGEVARQTLSFLKTGKFIHSEDE